jgi:serine/threonine protein kinase/ABC-type glycerol-3-phosphate transport system substrate-binding protein
VEFGVLGNLEVRRAGGAIVLGSYKQRSLLALLLIHANEVVSADRIIDELWGDEFVPGRQNALWVHMSNLRSAVEPDRPRRSEGTILLTRAPGYMLHVDPEAIDACRFQELVGEGRRLLDLDPAAASIALGEGLDLWRGRPYADVAYESFAQIEIGRLEELRLEAVEWRVDADLRRGLAAELIGELESLAAQHPLRERFTALLMLALYRAGRQSESLRAFDRLRSRLGDDLGILPSPALVDLEGRILAGDRSLEHDRAVPSRKTRLAVRGYEVREPIGDGNLGATYRAYQPAVGREVAITVLGPDVANDPAFIRRFDAEAELIARLEHPHIVPLYDYWREPDAAYLVTRDVRGGTLADAVGRQRFDEGDAVRLARDIGSALSLAHRCGVVHGAINPTSILIDDDGAAYLRDFSVAGDERNLTAWPTRVGRGHDSPFVAPEQRQGEPATAESDTYSLAMVVVYALTGREPTPLHPRDLSTGIAGVIERATRANIDARFHRAGSLVDALDAAVGVAIPVEHPMDVANPYTGLYPFAEPDTPDFFGRERLVERLVTRLGESGPRGRLLALVGPSGCGKSSVIHAGLVPALRKGAVPGSHEWFITSFSPGARPFEELHGALLRIAIDPPPDLIDQLTDGDDGIRHAVQRLLPDDDTQLLVVIDQLEELFTQAVPAMVHTFLDALTSAVNDPLSRLRVVVTVRADFYDRPLRHRGVGELLRHGTEVVTPMSPHEVERAITGPAERVGARFDRGLVAEIVADVAEHPGALPLLQYALTEIYERRRHHTMEAAAYREIGGLAAALARRAEDLYCSFDSEAQHVTRQVLLRMITVGENTEDLRRRVARQDLTVLGEPTVETVLERLGAHRLLSFDHDPVTRDPTVAIAHEALLTEWHRLGGWIDSSREDLRLERQLAAAAGDWKAADRHDEYVLRGTRLDRLTEWSATTDLALDPLERAFLEASVLRRDEEHAAEQRRRGEEDRLRARSRTRTRMLVASGVVLALTTVLAVYAITQRSEAQRLAGELADTGEARRLAAAATLTAEDAPDTAMLLAMQSLDTSARLGIPAVVEAEEALHWSLQAAHVPYGHADAPVEVRVGPNGPTGIVRLPMRDLVALASAHLRARRLTADECARFAITPCPADEPSAWPMIPAEPVRPELPAQNERPLDGTRITLTGAMDPAAVQADLAAFRDQTGIEVTYETPSLDADTEAMSARGVPLDLTVFARAASVRDSAEAGDLIDLATYLEADRARREFGDYAVDAVTVGGGYYAAPMFSGLKGVVWYPLREFAAAGYAPPQTWAELVALSHRMVHDGRTPWCLGFENEAFSGWPGTDWIEGLMLRIGGVDAYDGWMSGNLHFDSPIVRQAFDLFGEIAFTAGFVRYGTDAISRTSQFDAMDHLATDPPGCWMNYTGDWMGNNVRAATGGDAGFFVLPPMEAGGDTPVIGTSAMIGAFRDRPEVREFVRWMLDPSWGARWASDPNLTFLSPNVHFDPANCGSPDLPDDVNEVRVQLCELQRDTLVAGLQRPDASDEMPVEIGGVSDLGQRGAFLQAMLDYVDEGPTSLDDVLASIDAAWP